MDFLFEFFTTRNLEKPFLYIGTVTVQILAMMICLLVSLAFILLFDRKVWAAVQLRKGPNVVGPFGLLQSFADFIKFALKEVIIPAGADKPIFLLAPILSLITAFLAWTAIPVAPGLVISNLNMGILFIFAVSSLGVYGIIIGGWASNSKYPFLGAMRSSAQMVSYEVSLGFVFLSVILLTGSLNLTDIVTAQERGGGILNWYIWPLFPVFVVFFVSALAETNRPPFDLPEAESELVAGYQVEYSSTPYLLFMIAEYLNIVLMCALLSLLFLGGWNAPFNIEFLNNFPIFWFSAKVILMFFFFAMTKAIVPRYRYDQLMRLGWKIFLPLGLGYLVLVSSILVFIPEIAEYYSGWRS